MLKKISFGIFMFFLFALLSIYLSNSIIISTAKGKTYTTLKKIPKHSVGLLLGTSKILQNGHINLYYKYRLEAAIKLYNAGKIQFVLVSGDNGIKDYDEPTAFKEDLIKAGIPANKIFLDYAGFRTLDSMVRAKEIFGLSKFIIISQKFHNERAIYLANSKGIKAIGYNAKNVHSRYGFKTNLREKFARVKVFVDLLFNKQPKFLGKKITIE